MKRKALVVSGVATALLMISVTIFAHHGRELYDPQRMVTVKGVVTKFDFSNPHVLLYFDVMDKNGKVVNWVGETGSPNMMRRGGWDKNSLKKGDSITISGNPARNGFPGMRFLKIVMADGRQLDPASGFD